MHAHTIENLCARVYGTFLGRSRADTIARRKGGGGGRSKGSKANVNIDDAS